MQLLLCVFELCKNVCIHLFMYLSTVSLCNLFGSNFCVCAGVWVYTFTCACLPVDTWIYIFISVSPWLLCLSLCVYVSGHIYLYIIYFVSKCVHVFVLLRNTKGCGACHPDPLTLHVWLHSSPLLPWSFSPPLLLSSTPSLLGPTPPAEWWGGAAGWPSWWRRRGGCTMEVCMEEHGGEEWGFSLFISHLWPSLALHGEVPHWICNLPSQH